MAFINSLTCIKCLGTLVKRVALLPAELPWSTAEQRPSGETLRLNYAYEWEGELSYAQIQYQVLHMFCFQSSIE